jgi:hypothetical protein
MQARQQKLIESYQRIKTFLDEHTSAETPGFPAAVAAFTAVFTKLSQHSSAQVVGRQMSRAERRRLASLLRKLRDFHMKPIVTIAKTEIETQPGITDAFQLLKGSAGPVRVLAAAKAMRETAERFTPTFIAAGRPADFLTRFDTAIQAVEAALGDHARNIGTKVGAGAGLARELRKARRATEILDSLVKEAFEANDVILEKWRSAKRVRALPVIAAESPDEPATPPDISPEPVQPTPHAA